MTIGMRLGAGFGVLLAALCGVSALGIASLTRVGAVADQVITEDWRRSHAAHELRDGARASFVAALRSLQKTEQTPFIELRERVADARARIEEAMKSLAALAVTEADKTRLGKIETNRKAYLASLAEVLELAETGKIVQGEATVHRSLDPHFAALASSVDELVARNLERVQGSGAEQVAVIATARRTMMTIGVLTVLAGALFAWWLTRTLTMPLSLALSAAQRISSGRLDGSIEAHGADEVGQLLRALSVMQADLRAMIGEVVRSAGDVSTSASRIATGSHSSIGRAQAGTKATGSTAAAVEEMSVSIAQVAEHAEEAAGIAGKSSELAREGEAIVRAASGEMNSIAESVQHGSRLVQTLHCRSAQIGSIVKVIKDIADQTNLLALNAAIEAARAGEQGRGFAVVADEVRKLAERTGSATSEIGAMIDAIQRETRSVVETMQNGGDKVALGVKLADEAAAALEKIKAQALDAVTSVNAIAAATRKQQAASTGIARNVERISRMAEESGVATKESAESARQLEELASALQARVSRFVL